MGVDPAPLTLAALARMAEARSRSEWERTAQLTAAVLRIGGAVRHPDDCNPHKAAARAAARRSGRDERLRSRAAELRDARRRKPARSPTPSA